MAAHPVAHPHVHRDEAAAAVVTRVILYYHWDIIDAHIFEILVLPLPRPEVLKK